MPEVTDLEELRQGTELVKRGFARMQKGGVIMDVVDREQARIAEDAGAVAVMVLENVPADIRKRGGVARMPDPERVPEVIDEVSIPVMGKSRIGHRKEAEILEALGVDMIDESEVLTPATTRTTLTSATSPRRSCVAPGTSPKPSDGSARARP
ncbi:MAG: SOR/SNZ family [uncultured archaeon A07HR67]|nr:MAG: SOR/SNZ family [uncultured archaeon A07HR67]